MRPSLKWPLIIAAVFVVARVVVERLGAPGPANFISVVALYLIVFPVYFALRIAKSPSTHPYRDQFILTAAYAALARAMVIPTYWLAYIYEWPEGRFKIGQGGVVGPGATLSNAITTPLGAAAAWILLSLIVGGGIGSAIIAWMRGSATRRASA